jgi:protoheme IX farnesyltransferase
VREGREGDRVAKQLFVFSIFYLFALFAVLIGEHIALKFI